MRLEEAFHQVAINHPHKSALHGKYTYRELDIMSSEVAKSLEKKTIGPEPVTFDDCWHLSMLSILKAGKVPAYCESQGQKDFIGDSVLPYHDGAYIAFTSGTTGVPKAVVHSHGGAFRLARAWRTIYRLKPEDRVAQLSKNTQGYRVAWATWLAGATLFDSYDTGIIADWINDEKITILPLTASWFRSLMASGKKFPSVRVVDIGGEMVDAGDFELYRERFSDDCIFVNRYACSEAQTISWQVFGKDSVVEPGRMPVGSTAGARIVDEQLNVLKDGLMGEIMVSTSCMAIEYWNNPELTAKKFIHCYGGRWYLTGDSGFRRDGLLHVTGRKDFQGEVRDKFNAEQMIEQNRVKAMLEIPGL